MITVVSSGDESRLKNAVSSYASLTVRLGGVG